MSAIEKSIFSAGRLELKQVFDLLYSFCEKKTIFESGVEGNVSDHTVRSYYNLFRKILIDYDPLEIINEKLGENVEMDETHLYTFKHSKGRIIAGQKYWVVGAISRETKQIKLLLTLQRSKPILNDFALNSIHLQSNVYTDCWRGYNDLSSLGYNHITINHSHFYVDPNDALRHTNTVERLWRSLKTFLPGNLRYSDLKRKITEFQSLYNYGLKSVSERYFFMVKAIKFYNF